MTCPLCDPDVADRRLYATLLTDYEEDGRVDWLGFKRDIEDDVDGRLTVSGLKRHFDEHVQMPV